MDTQVIEQSRVHHGHNIRRVRKEKGIKQAALADAVCLAQQTISRYEDMKIIDEEMLNRFAKALDVPVDDLKNLEEDNKVVIIENNTFTNSTVFGDADFDKENVYNPLEKVIELCNQKVELYERLLSVEKEKVTWLEKLLENKI